MSEPLATTCAGWGSQQVGGRCPKREDCRRYLFRNVKNEYPQESFLCTVGKWEWFFPLKPGEQSRD